MTDDTFEGRVFPSEAEWLSLVPPADLVADDFVARTLAALRDPTPEQLAAYAPPAPSTDFVARTLGAVQQDRRDRWREMLSRYVAPNPSSDFVARTLAALRDARGELPPREATVSPVAGPDGRGGRLLRFALPLLAVAAAVVVFALRPDPVGPTLELRAVATLPAAFGPAHAPTALPALFAAIDRAATPQALADTGADGIWLVMHARPANGGRR